MDSDFKNKLMGILDSNDFAKTINSLSQEEKLDILFSKDYLSNLIIRKCDLNGVKLFGSKEITSLWQGGYKSNFYLHT